MWLLLLPAAILAIALGASIALTTSHCCCQVLFKMDKLGACQQVKLEDLVLNRDISFVGFTVQMFLEVG